MKTDTIIWDFDGTLLPLTPYDSEQTLMLYKLDETAPRPLFFVRAIARLLIGADRRHMLRKTFKRFYISQGRINGMTLHVANPVDKVKWLKKMGICADDTVAVGDGYTDIPLLDWAKIAVLVDRAGQKKAKFRHKNYRFISSTSEILDVLN